MLINSSCKNETKQDLLLPKILSNVRKNPHKIAILYLSNDNTAIHSLSYKILWVSLYRLARDIKQFIERINPPDKSVAILTIEDGFQMVLSEIALSLLRITIIPYNIDDPRLLEVGELLGYPLLITDNEFITSWQNIPACHGRLTPESFKENNQDKQCFVFSKNLVSVMNKESRNNDDIVTEDRILESLGSLNEDNQIHHIFFTSGSTGLPKGCKASRVAFSQYCMGAISVKNVTEDSVVFLASPLSFDPSIGDIFSTLMAGASLAVTGKNNMIFNLTSCLRLTKSTHLLTTPTIFRAVDRDLSRWERQDTDHQSFLPQFSHLALGGEPMSTELIQRWCHRVRLVNVYGLTETCVYQGFTVIPKSPQSHDSAELLRRTICHSFEGFNLILMQQLMENHGGNSDLFLERLETNEFVAENGCIGELWIYGCCLDSFSGYIGVEQSDGEKFIRHRKLGLSLRTGDMGVYESFQVKQGQGSETYFGIKLLGRMDTQFKINGRRMDFEEIESVLENRLPPTLVTQLGCTVFDSSLIGWCVSNVNHDVSSSISSDRADELARFRSDILRHISLLYLPSNMVPNTFCWTDSLPTTRSGKLSRKEMARMYESLGWNHASDKDGYIELDSAMEHTVAQVWSEVLELEKKHIHPSTNFLLAGGDSLLAVYASQLMVETLKQENQIENLAEIKKLSIEDKGTFGEGMCALGPETLIKYPVLSDYARVLEKFIHRNSTNIKVEKATKASTESLTEYRVRLLKHAFLLKDKTSIEVILDLLQSGEQGAKDVLNEQRLLHCACYGKNTEAFIRLLKEPFSLNLMGKGVNGALPIHHAASNLKVTALEMVVEKMLMLRAAKRSFSWCVSQIDHNKQTPLHYAARSGAESEVLLFLLKEEVTTCKVGKKGSQLECYDSWGRTALHWATVNGHMTTVKILLEIGARTDIRDINGEIPVEIAERRARCGASERSEGARSSLFGSIASLLGGSGSTKSVAQHTK